MIELPSDADIDASPQAVFDVISDVGGQDRWLTRSSAFRGTTELSANPVTLGTTYREPGPLGVRNGTVVEYERPGRIAFRQPMTIRLGLGTIEIVMRYSLTVRGATTHVRRTVTIGVPWPLRIVQPLVVRAFRIESARTLMALKTYCDSLS